jgi:cob(I)alamin adenosyltransferase
VVVKIYTKTGDEGLTGLLGSRRVPKDDARIVAYGTIDELNAALGLARSQKLDHEADALVGRLQDELFAVGSALADPNPDGPFHATISEANISRLEAEIDRLADELPPLTRFILPCGTAGAAAIHLARTICRRAERALVHLGRTPGEQVPGGLLAYLNRLSDLLFVLARVVNQRAGVDDVPWRGPGA